jgi:hypothetical protein
MDSITLFLFACIPARILIAWYSTKVVDLKMFGFFLLVLALSFLYLYFTNKRLQAPEANGKTWWSEYRLIIGLLYLTAAIYAIQGKRELVKYPIIIDIFFGLYIFYKKHF